MSEEASNRSSVGTLSILCRHSAAAVAPTISRSAASASIFHSLSLSLSLALHPLFLSTSLADRVIGKADDVYQKRAAAKSEAFAIAFEFSSNSMQPCSNFHLPTSAPLRLLPCHKSPWGDHGTCWILELVNYFNFYNKLCCTDY